MSHLGILVALRDEASPLTQSKPELRTAVPLADNVTLMVSGMGADNATRAARRLLEQGATALLSFGTAAGLAPQLRSGDLLLADQLRDAAGTVHGVDEPWQQRLHAALAESVCVFRGGICESHRVIASAADKAELYRQTGCLALDMESAALATLAGQVAVPFVSLRAIVDTADMHLPASLLAALDEDGNVSLKKLLPALLPRPVDWLALVRLAGGFRAASRSLAVCRQRADVDFMLPD